jgi:hypothetical protein
MALGGGAWGTGSKYPFFVLVGAYGSSVFHSVHVHNECML